MPYRARRQRTAVHRQDVAQHGGFPSRVKYRPLAPFLDPPDLQRKSGPLIDEAQQSEIEVINLSANRSQA